MTHKTTNYSTLDIYCDGGARGNPGPAAAAFVVASAGSSIHQSGQSLGPTTNNVAEYTAVKLALDWLVTYTNSHPVTQVNFFLDSNLVVNQINGQFKTKQPHLKSLHSQVTHQLAQLKLPITFSYIPRSRNYRADALVNQTLDSLI